MPGFSLIELLLVLALASVILLMGLGHYQQLQHGRDIKAVRRNVALLMNALEQLYQQRQPNDAPFHPTIEKLKRTGNMPTLVRTSLINAHAQATETGYSVTAYTIGVNTLSKRPIYVLQVTASLTPIAAHTNIIQQQLNASAKQTDTLIWRHIANLVPNSTSPSHWLTSLYLRRVKAIEVEEMK